MRLGHHLQYLVLKTSFPPLLPLYRGIYALASRHIVWCLRRVPGVKAIYQHGGFVRGDLVPGISDIDTTIFIEPQARTQVEALCQRCGRLWPMFRKSYDIQILSDYQRYGLQNVGSRFQCFAGILYGKRVYGDELLRDYGRLPADQLPLGYYLELPPWWSHLCKEILPMPTSRRDEAWQLSIGYKVMAEIARLNYALMTGEYVSRRRPGLERGRAWLDAEGQALAVRALAQHSSRFLRHDPTFGNDLLRYMLRFLHDFHQNKLPALPAARPALCLSQRVDASPSEMFLSEKERETIQELIEAAQDLWGTSYRGASLAPSAYYDIETLVLILHSDPCCPPSREALAQFIAQAKPTLRGLQRSINIHLGLPGLSLRLCSLNAERRYRQSLLSRGFFSEALSLSDQPGFLLDGIASAVEPPVWTAWQEEYLLNWRCQKYWLPAAGLADEPFDHLSEWEFLCGWWKALQLLMIERSIHRGEVVYPLTLPAIGRALEREGMPLPESLRVLEDAFVCELAGQSAKITSLIPEAMVFLRRVDTQTQEEFSPCP